MENENEKVIVQKCENKCKHSKGSTGFGCGIYGLGFIGALIFFIQNSATFSVGVVGFLKALVWPAFLVYQLFNFLK